MISTSIRKQRKTNSIHQPLQEAFALFSKETLRLEEAYQALRNECSHLKEKLKLQNHMLSSILTHVSQGLIFVSSNGSIKILNKAAAKFLEFSEKEIIGLPFWEIFSDDYFGFSMKKALLSENRTKETLFVSFGEEKEAEITRSMLPSKEGIIILLRELTEERRLKRTIERNDRLKELGEMASALAHEIRNPLGGIEGFASLLFEDLKSNPPLQQMVDAILEGTKCLNQLVTNILDYAKPEVLHLELTDLVQVIKRAVAFIEVDHGRKCHFILDIKSNSLPLYLDPGLIQRALINLLLNASEASEEGGEITLLLHIKRKEVVLKVIDRGSGMDKKEQEKLFTPFFTTKSHGNGLGLSEALKSIQAHGGTIAVSSKKGKGSIFTIKFPKYGHREDFNYR